MYSVDLGSLTAAGDREMLGTLWLVNLVRSESMSISGCIPSSSDIGSLMDERPC